MHPVTWPWWAWSCLWMMAAFWPAYLLLLAAGVRRHRHRFAAVDAKPYGQAMPFEKPQTVVTWLCQAPRCPDPPSGLMTTIIAGRIILDDIKGTGVPTTPNDFDGIRA